MGKASRSMAFGGVMAALAVVIMCMGTLVPLATFVCPLLCILTAAIVYGRCGAKVAWAWYGAVAILSMLLAPDKEAAAVLVFLGYYPMIKPWLERSRLRWLWKGLLFHVAVFLLYSVLVYVFGMTETVAEFREAGIFLGAVTLVLGNVTFFLLKFL